MHYSLNMSELEPAIRQLFDATNRGDSEAFLDAFAPDGVVDDWGRTFSGREAIAGWNASENIGVNSHIETTGVERDGDAIKVGVAVSGDGYNGGGAFTFTLAADGKIARRVITG
jgi:ketosteroid isomerase-like protein